MKIILTERQVKYLKSKFIFESDEVNQYGFTPDEMNRIEEFVRNNVKEYYEHLVIQVEEGKALPSTLEKIKNHIKNNPDIDETIFDYVIKDYESKIKQYERNKKSLENFDFEKYVKDGIERDI